MQFLGNFGNGQDGALSISSPTTHSPINASCSGTAGATSLSATGSFVAGQIILIRQARGTGELTTDNWELNVVESYSPGTITTRYPLARTYADSGANQADVTVVAQHTSVDISSTLTVSAWDGNIGGIYPIFATGKVTITGSITGKGKGFLGGAYQGVAPSVQSGEGTGGARSSSGDTNGNGAGAAVNDRAGVGGGNGSAGQTVPGGADQIPGSAVTISSLGSMHMGGGGSGGSSGNPGGSGGNGGAVVVIFAREFVCTSGTVDVRGNDGGGGVSGRGGGGGAGGAIFVKALTATIGTSKLLATKGVGGVGTEQTGGDGGDGLIRIEACSLNGSSDPANVASAGGYSWCSTASQVI